METARSTNSLSGSDEMWAGNVSAFLMNSFILDDYTEKNAGTFLRVIDGKVDFTANKDEWKQGLIYLNKLYKEGLIDPVPLHKTLTRFSKWPTGNQTTSWGFVYCADQLCLQHG